MNSNDRRSKLDFLMRKARGRCALCRMPVRNEDASLDHIIPRAAGGGNEIANLRLAHRWCNSRRGAVFLGVDYGTAKNKGKLAPKVNGDDLAEELRRLQPPVKCVCPHCGSTRMHRLRQGTPKRRRCRDCGAHVPRWGAAIRGGLGEANP